MGREAVKSFVSLDLPFIEPVCGLIDPSRVRNRNLSALAAVFLFMNFPQVTAEEPIFPRPEEPAQPEECQAYQAENDNGQNDRNPQAGNKRGAGVGVHSEINGIGKELSIHSQRVLFKYGFILGLLIGIITGIYIFFPKFARRFLR